MEAKSFVKNKYLLLFELWFYSASEPFSLDDHKYAIFVACLEI
jgi:hypothetical protein